MDRATVTKKLTQLAALTCSMLLAAPVLGASAFAGSSYIAPSDKGGFQYSAPSPYPELDLDLTPIENQVAREASKRCGTTLAAAPLDLGDAEGFMSEMLGKAANAAVGQLIGGLLGGGGGSKKQPPLHRDPIKSKYKEKFDHPSGDARIRIGGQQYKDGLLISARVDKAAGKGTFHTMFLERPDCSRVFPEQYLGYKLWGSWSLSVSVTKTTSTYKNGELVDRTSSTSGWSKSGTFDASRSFSLWDQLPGEARRMMLDADEAYLAQLRREIGMPAWQQMGFGEPTQGIRDAGGIFPVTPADLTPGTIAVVHITHLEDGRYRTVGFPFKFSMSSEGRLSFESLL